MLKTRQLLWIFLICSTLATRAALAQSTLTQVRDTVVNSDGTPFNGTVTITWNGFTGPNGGAISPLSTSARIYSGALSVLLVPTTTASAGAFYQAVYNSSGSAATWTEIWQVPPSSTALTLSAIRTSSSQGPSSGGSSSGSGSSGPGSGGTGGSQYAVLPISINQVTSLSADLASINNVLGALAAQVNGLNVSVSALGPGTSALFVDGEAPAGILNGVNPAFNLSQMPNPAGSVTLYRNGLMQTAGVDYTLTGSTITFLPGSTPNTGDTLSAYYRIPGTAPLASFVDTEVPAGAINGSNLSFTLALAPNPALSLKLYKNGVLLNQNYDYTLSGNTITFGGPSVAPQSGDALVAAYRH